MRSHFRLRRRDARWLLFPVVVVFVGLSAIGMVVFTPDLATPGVEAVFSLNGDAQPATRHVGNPAEESDF